MENKSKYNYTTEYLVRELPAEDYFSNYYFPEKFLGCCKACSNYGKVWACPPFERDTLTEMGPYSKILLIACRLTPESKEIPLSAASDFMKPERIKMEKKIRELEMKYRGKGMAFAGTCLYCPPGTCTREEGKPCRHPDLARPSLEAYGFDVGKTVEEVFGEKILWSKDRYLPLYLTLVMGLFHNEPSLLDNTILDKEIIGQVSANY